jgi:hypothetical protein
LYQEWQETSEPSIHTPYRTGSPYHTSTWHIPAYSSQVKNSHHRCIEGLSPKSRKFLRIIAHCGVYEYMKMPLGIKNYPSHSAKEWWTKSSSKNYPSNGSSFT